jgi:hypothetical protein
MEGMRAAIQHGWTVVGSDGEAVGKVTDVREDLLVVERGMLHKELLYVPIDQVRPSTDHDTVALDIAASDVTEQGWQYPPSAPYDHQVPAYPEVPDTTMIQAAGYSSGSLSAPEAQGFVRNAEETPEEEQIPNALYNPEGEDRPD